MSCIGSILFLLIVSVNPPFPAQWGEADSLQKSKTALYFESLGLVNVAEIDGTIPVKLMYACRDNFTGRTLYDDLKEAYLHPDAAKAFVAAQRILKKRHPSYTLIIYDAARPMSVQQRMWEAVRGTSKSIYVSNPARGGGLHNYGLAVDVSILDEWGNPLPMGTEVDYLGQEAHITHEVALVEQGKITPEEWRNRLLLRQVMRESGFHTLSSEWWHFNWCNRETARQKYVLIE
jgi:D-alanyl-D-alanine dipeptidase